MEEMVATVMVEVLTALAGTVAVKVRGGQQLLDS